MSSNSFSNYFQPTAKSSTESQPSPIKNVSVFLSLDNCHHFMEKANHQDRIQKIRTEGLNYIKETEFLYANSSANNK